jgi:hypothetical protein
MARPDGDVDLGALLDLTTPWCLHVVATLGIGDHIAAGVQGIDELAAAAGCDAGALQSVLTHLVAMGVFVQESPGRYGLNRAAEDLRRAAPFLNLYGIGSRFALAWGSLLAYVRTGRPAYHQLFGRPFWDDLAAHPALAAEFDALMGPAGHGVTDYDIELAEGWDGVEAVVDVGGGTGSLLAELLRRHPDVRGTLVDLPATAGRAGETFTKAGVADRVTTVGQSFFDPLPAGGDVYVLKSVLNDWPERETVAILRRCAEVAGTRGRIVVIGGVAPDDAPPRLTIEMVLVGGRTNSLAGFRELVGTVGLEVRAAGVQASGRYVVELVRADGLGEGA